MVAGRAAAFTRYSRNFLASDSYLDGSSEAPSDWFVGKAHALKINARSETKIDARKLS